jgi:3-phenylpropionate/cinnamic acid dioxygenase small subunit
VTISRAEAEDFLYLQAKHLNSRNYEEWLSLFTTDARYWMPARPGDDDPEAQLSFLYDDFPVMVARCERLLAEGTAGQQPITRSSHVISNVVVGDSLDDGDIVVDSRFLATQYRRETLKYYSGTTRHHLVRTEDGLRIRLQRVELIDCDGIHDAILQVYL